MITCKELAEILLKTPDMPVMIAKAEVDGDLGGVWTDSHQEYLEKKLIKTMFNNGVEVIVLDDNPWA